MSCYASLSSMPLKVFIFAGQSNMQGHALPSTLAYLGMDPETAPDLEKIQLPPEETAADSSNAKPKYREFDNVWISVIGIDRSGDEDERHGKVSVGYGANWNKLGPELGFGLAMQDEMEPDQHCLIIKTAWGGKSLHTDFRSPSAGPFEYSESQMQQLLNTKGQDKTKEELAEEKRTATGQYYRLMMKHLQHVLQDIGRVCPAYNHDVGYELSGFVWFQGWNDVTDRFVYNNRHLPGGYDEYGRLLSLFIQDVRSDLSVLTLPFVIGVIGVGGPQSDDTLHGRFRHAMEMPVTKDGLENVAIVRTEAFWDTEIGELDDKWYALQTKIKTLKENQKMEPREEQEQIDALKSETFLPGELDLLNMAKSNFAFHYLGSAKFFVRAGKAFAKAILDGNAHS